MELVVTPQRWGTGTARGSTPRFFLAGLDAAAWGTHGHGQRSARRWRAAPRGSTPTDTSTRQPRGALALWVCFLEATLNAVGKGSSIRFAPEPTIVHAQSTTHSLSPHLDTMSALVPESPPQAAQPLPTPPAHPIYHNSTTIINAHTDGSPIEADPIINVPPRRVIALFSRPLPANPPYYEEHPSAHTAEPEGAGAGTGSGSGSGSGAGSGAGAGAAATAEAGVEVEPGSDESHFGYGWRGSLSTLAPMAHLTTLSLGRSRDVRGCLAELAPLLHLRVLDL